MPVGITMHIGRMKIYIAVVRFLGRQVLRDTVYELRMYPPVPNKTPTGIIGRVSAITMVRMCINLMYLVR